ncbi:hypothetical protein GOP47_0029317 [Adiantum capillus-veneris]|nr:hypothetical protein GOP47_0029317 [Adiantum capillus-veneris]
MYALMELKAINLSIGHHWYIKMLELPVAATFYLHGQFAVVRLQQVAVAGQQWRQPWNCKCSLVNDDCVDALVNMHAGCGEFQKD